MLLFVEGIDKAGKSTLIQHLNKHTSIPVYRKQPPNLSVADHHNFFKGVGYALVELHNLLKFDVIVDRPFISDWVYTNKSSMQKNFTVWFDWEERQHSIAESVILYVYIPDHIFAHRIANDPDPYMDVNDFSTHIDLYEKYLQYTTLPVVQVRGDISFDEQLSGLVSWVETLPYSSLRNKLEIYINRRDIV